MLCPDLVILRDLNGCYVLEWSILPGDGYPLKLLRSGISAILSAFIAEGIPILVSLSSEKYMSVCPTVRGTENVIKGRRGDRYGKQTESKEKEPKKRNRRPQSERNRQHK